MCTFSKVHVSTLYCTWVSHASMQQLNSELNGGNRRLAAFKKPKKGKKKGDAAPAEPVTVSSATIYVASVYPDWQEAVLKLLNSKYNPATKTFPDNRELMPELKAMDTLQDKKVFKKVMPFISFIRAQMDEHGRDALSHIMPFDEVEVLQVMSLSFGCGANPACAYPSVNFACTRHSCVCCWCCYGKSAKCPRMLLFLFTVKLTSCFRLCVYCRPMKFTCKNLLSWSRWRSSQLLTVKTKNWRMIACRDLLSLSLLNALDIIPVNASSLCLSPLYIHLRA